MCTYSLSLSHTHSLHHAHWKSQGLSPTRPDRELPASCSVIPDPSGEIFKCPSSPSFVPTEPLRTFHSVLVPFLTPLLMFVLETISVLNTSNSRVRGSHWPHCWTRMDVRHCALIHFSSRTERLRTFGAYYGAFIPLLVQKKGKELICGDEAAEEEKMHRQNNENIQCRRERFCIPTASSWFLLPTQHERIGIYLLMLGFTY